MSKIIWDALGERKYEIGVDRGVLYRSESGEYTNGIAWNGLTGVDDNNGGREATPLYSGGIKAATAYTADEYSGKIKCFMYPDEFDEFLGEREIINGIFARQQERYLFAFSYRSFVGNDTDGTDLGYKIHLIYNMEVTDFGRSYSTVNDSMDAKEIEISFDTYPQEIDNDEYDPVSEIVLDSRVMSPETLEALEAILYGSETSVPRLPYPDEIIELFNVPEPLPPEWILYPNFLINPYGQLYPVAQEEEEGGD